MRRGTFTSNTVELIISHSRLQIGYRKMPTHHDWPLQTQARQASLPSGLGLHGELPARARGVPLVDRMADHGGEFTHQTIGHLSGHRQLAAAPASRARSLGVGAGCAARL